jgi:hypothetical protein
MQENHYAEKAQFIPGNFKHNLPCLKTQAFLCFALPRMTTKIKKILTLLYDTFESVQNQHDRLIRRRRIVSFETTGFTMLFPNHGITAVLETASTEFLTVINTAKPQRRIQGWLVTQVAYISGAYKRSLACLHSIFFIAKTASAHAPKPNRLFHSTSITLVRRRR